jgi:SAM-dependent methyltransferase
VEVSLYRRLLVSLGRPLPERACALDLGCGDGRRVGQLLEAGFDAWGCDVVLAGNETGRIRLIEQPYRLPFENDSFDLVCSTEVLEHVRDHDTTLREVARVLKPAGSSIHTFPPKLSPFEQHVFVPLGGAIQARIWLSLWALLGIRNGFQAGLSWRDVASGNQRYLKENTNYLTRGQLIRVGRDHFHEARFIEREYMDLTRGELLRRINGWSPLVGYAYGGLRSRVMLLARPVQG